MSDGLIIAVAVLALVLASAVLGLPAIWLGVRAARKDPANSQRRSLVFAAGSGAVSGALLGLTGFVFGAGIGDESAGTIATGLLSGGCFGGFLAGAVVTWAGIRLWLKLTTPAA